MCTRIADNGHVYEVGDMVKVISAMKEAQVIWMNLTRSETAHETWKNNFLVELDIPVDGFTEVNRYLSKQSRKKFLTPQSVTPGMVIYGLGDRRTGQLLILTRDANPEEKLLFGHNRVPVIGSARY